LTTTAADGTVQLILEATGRSIPPELIPAFFDVLAVRDSITPGGDLGLAPAVAERIVSSFGGSLTVENLDAPGIRLGIRLKTTGTEPS
jgi:C4-dicarboxylate-specific signal transduction histidine kinase